MVRRVEEWVDDSEAEGVEVRVGVAEGVAVEVLSGAGDIVIVVVAPAGRLEALSEGDGELDGDNPSTAEAFSDATSTAEAEEPLMSAPASSTCTPAPLTLQHADTMVASAHTLSCSAYAPSGTTPGASPTPILAFPPSPAAVSVKAAAADVTFPPLTEDTTVPAAADAARRALSSAGVTPSCQTTVIT